MNAKYKTALLIFALMTIAIKASAQFQVKYRNNGLEWSQFIDKTVSNGCTHIRNCTLEGEDGQAIDLINLKKANVGVILTGEYHENHIMENNAGRKPFQIKESDKLKFYKVFTPHSEAEQICHALDPGRARLPTAQEASEMQLSLKDDDPDYWGETNDFWEKVDPGTSGRIFWTSTVKAGSETKAIIMSSAGNGVFGGQESRHMPPRHYIGVRCVRSIK